MKPTPTASLQSLSSLRRKLDSNQSTAKHLKELDIADVYCKPQPRKKFLHIEELAQSLKEIGLQQPIVVNPDGKGKYVVEQGERRVRAAKLAGFTKIEAVVKHSETALRRTVQQLAENVQRDEMKLGELSESIHSLKEAGLSIRDIARQLGKKESYVSTLNACAELPPALQELVDGQHIKDPVSLSRLKNAHQDNPDKVEYQIAQWSNAPVSEVSDTEDSEAATFVITRAQVNSFIKSLREEAQAQPATKDVNDFVATDAPERLVDPAKSEDGSNEADDYEEPAATPLPSDTPSKKETASREENGSKKLNPDETLVDIPEGYARCSSTDFRVYVKVKGMGEGCLTPNVIPPKGKISVILSGDGKTVEVDPNQVTLIAIGTKHKNART